MLQEYMYVCTYTSKQGLALKAQALFGIPPHEYATLCMAYSTYILSSQALQCATLIIMLYLIIMHFKKLLTLTNCVMLIFNAHDTNKIVGI